MTLQRRETLSRQAYAAVRKAIRDGVLAPGTLYSELQVATALGMSRTPVREGLIELARDGIIEKVPQRGFRLRPISESELKEAFELRELLEVHVVRRLAQNALPSQIQALRRILEEQENVLDDPGQFLELDEQFHLAMSDMLGLSRTRQMLLSLRAITSVAGAAALAHAGRVTDVLAEHESILDGVSAHSPDIAESAVRKHMSHTRVAAAASLNLSDEATRPELTREAMSPGSNNEDS